MVEHNTSNTKKTSNTHVSIGINAELKHVRDEQRKMIPHLSGRTAKNFIQELPANGIGETLGDRRYLALKMVSVPAAEIVEIYAVDRNVSYLVWEMRLRDFLDFVADIMDRSDAVRIVWKSDPDFVYDTEADVYTWTVEYSNELFTELLRAESSPTVTYSMRAVAEIELTGSAVREAVLMLMNGIAMTMRHDVWNAYTYIPRELSSWVIGSNREHSLVLSILYWNGRTFRNAFLGGNSEESIDIKPYKFSLQQLRAFAMGMIEDGEELLVDTSDGRMSIRPYTGMVASWAGKYTSIWTSLELPTT